MIHEFKKIVTRYQQAQAEQGAVLATVVDLEGSSYRKPGVRMLIFENGQMVGAVSGGCVEKAVYKEALEVFETGQAKMMTYDGRFRLGCEGILYILIEPFQPNSDFLQAFHKGVEERLPIEFISFYQHQEGLHAPIGSLIKLQGQVFPLAANTTNVQEQAQLLVFTQVLPPCFKLVIIGGEHDAVQLCLFASLNGWEVTIITHPTEQKSLHNFPGAQQVKACLAEQLDQIKIDQQTAVVLMTHNFAKDLTFLQQLQTKSMAYVGLLGPVKRREKLLAQLLMQSSDIDTDFLEKLHGPAGLNIGAVTPQEIALSIIAEILAVTTGKEPISLSQRNEKIHI